MAAAKTQKAAIEHFAARSHDAWRREFQKNNPDQANQPRMRMRGGKMVDINQPWSALDGAAKADNKRAAGAAYEALERFPKDREKAAAYVHKQWIKRNRADPNQSQELMTPYADLPDAEKDKDRVHIDQMKTALAAVKKSKKKPSKKDKTAKAEAKAKTTDALQLDAQMAARLTVAAQALSEATGRKVTAQALLVAGAEAVLAICETAAPAERKKKR